jgi:hypothetical protein
MDWTIAFFRTQAKKWADRQIEMLTISRPDDRTSIHNLSRGHICYAYRQEAMWLKFAELASDRFSKVKEDVERSERSGRDEVPVDHLAQHPET